MPRLKKVTEWNRPECRRVTEEVNKALSDVGRKLGINIERTGNGQFNEANFTFKVECSLIGKDGEIRDRESENFKKYANLYGLKPEHFGAKFKTWDNKEFTICGLNMRAPRNPIHAKNSRGKTYIFPAEQVKTHLERA